MVDSKDWIAAIIMAVLAIAMYFMTNVLKEMVQEPNRMNTTIIDNFLDLEDPILKQIQTNKDIWKQCNDENPKFWNGKTNPENIWEELAKRIWEDRPEFQSAVGFEYWCNILKGGQHLPWHIDKDEEAMEESYELITPLYGSVYYGFDHDGQFEGGKLWLINADAYDGDKVFEKRHKDGLVEVDANYNRVVYFNASLWHKVSDIPSGKRYTFAVNALQSIPRRIARAKQ